MLIGLKFGLKGLIVAVILGMIAWKLGLVDPQMFLADGSFTVTSGAVEAGPEEQERFDFVKVVMADTEDVWTEEFHRVGDRYEDL